MAEERFIKSLPFIVGFDESVKGYFKDNLYEGFSQPFELEGYETSYIDPRILCAIPKGLDEEIDKPDRVWEQGLARVGSRFNITLRLPVHVYMK